MTTAPSLRFLPEHDQGTFAWSALKRYHDISVNASRILNDRSIPNDHRKNVEKQLIQMRFCLQQAEQYSISANVSEISVRPLLLYYCAMSLAIAESLWLGDGNITLDKRAARDQNHGMEFHMQGTSLPSEFAAQPKLVNGISVGSFGIWHKFARHLPLVCVLTQVESDNRTFSQEGFESLTSFTPIVENPTDSMPRTTLQECLTYVPGMGDVLRHYGLYTSLVRGTIEKKKYIIRNAQKEDFTFFLHPANPEALARVANLFQVPPRLVSSCECHAYRSGYYLKISETVDMLDGTIAKLPFGFPHSGKLIYFHDNKLKLNEFGLYYFGLSICSNIVRYFPHIWMKHLERKTTVFILIQEFLHEAAKRLPVLMLSSLDEASYVSRNSAIA